jgi:hypothetical protein
MVNKTRKNKNYIFSVENYKSGDGMLTSVWGPSLWHFLHTMSFNYPDTPSKQDKKYYKSFILQLENVLPCKYCRLNLEKNFKAMPLQNCHMKSRYSFSKYIYDLHEHINKMLGKTSGLSYEDVQERYEHFRARCGKKKKTITIKKRHKGCTEPLHKVKSKGIVSIVPASKKCESLQISSKCTEIKS